MQLTKSVMTAISASKTAFKSGPTAKKVIPLKTLSEEFKVGHSREMKRKTTATWV